MSFLDAVLEALARTPEEQGEYWLRRQREEYDRWWALEENLAVLEQFDAVDKATVEQVHATQTQINQEQAERGKIRDGLIEL